VAGFHRGIQDAVVRGFDQVFWIATGVALVGLVVACLVPRRFAEVRKPECPGPRITG
jgi:hypothetical protein